jgi:hypothetical protein
MPAQEIEVQTPAARERQESLLARVDLLLDDSRATQEHLARNFIQIGIALLEVDKSRAWTLRAKSSDQYIKDCEGRFGRGRTALYAYKSVAENLLPHMPEQKLVEIGISKAQPLATFVKNSGKKPPAKLLAAAENPKVGVEEFRASIAETLHEKPESGKWYEFLSGFYVSAEEKAEFERAIQAAKAQIELPENCSEWLERKLVAQCFVAECLSSWGA